MRLLLLLTLLAAPLLAQDPQAGARAKKDRITELVKRVRAGDHDARAAALLELARLKVDDIRLLIEIAGKTPRAFHVDIDKWFTDFDVDLDGDLDIFVPGSESMSGTWSKNGEKASYSVTTRGDGTYDLKATIRGENGNERRIEDRGSLGDLRRKYEFLQLGVIFRVGSTPPLLPARRVVAVARPASPVSVAVAGLRVRRPSADLRHHLALIEGAGLIVDSVDKGSVAEQAGLRRFDIVVRLDGNLVETEKQLEALARKPVRIEIIRRAKPLTLSR